MNEDLIHQSLSTASTTPALAFSLPFPSQGPALDMTDFPVSLSGLCVFAPLNGSEVHPPTNESPARACPFPGLLGHRPPRSSSGRLTGYQHPLAGGFAPTNKASLPGLGSIRRARYHRLASGILGWSVQSESAKPTSIVCCSTKPLALRGEKLVLVFPVSLTSM